MIIQFGAWAPKNTVKGGCKSSTDPEVVTEAVPGSPGCLSEKRDGGEEV